MWGNISILFHQLCESDTLYESDFRTHIGWQVNRFKISLVASVGCMVWWSEAEHIRSSCHGCWTLIIRTTLTIAFTSRHYIACPPYMPIIIILNEESMLSVWKIIVFLRGNLKWSELFCTHLGSLHKCVIV